MQRMIVSTVCLIGFVALAGGCAEARSGWVADGNAVDFGPPRWAEHELAAPIAVREIRRTEQASHHVARLTGAELPHVHDRHDLTVFVLSGTVRMHMADSTWIMRRGDVAQVPHGLTHFAEHIGTADEPSEAYLVFTPPFDGTDTRRVE